MNILNITKRWLGVALVTGLIFFIIPSVDAISGPTVSQGKINYNGRSWQAFPGWTGAVNAGAGDINANSFQEVIATAGAGTGPQVRIFSSDGRLVGQFDAYNGNFHGGVNLAVGDVNGDGRAEIVTAAGAGGGPHVRVFNHRGEILKEWFAYEATYTGGVGVSIQGSEVVTWKLDETKTHEMSVPFHKQEHNLSCEVASLRSALLYKGVNVTESELIKYQPVSYPKEYKNGVWGDPSQGYVGDIDGSQPRFTGYGIYWKPIAELAKRYRPAESFRHVDWNFIKEEILSDNAVIIWGNYNLYPRATIWQTSEGANVLGFIGEHTYVVLGWEGNPNQPDSVIVLDPMRGRMKMSFANFMENWSYLDYSGVVVK
jgi:uncharacterized protein YvpB